MKNIYKKKNIIKISTLFSVIFLMTLPVSASIYISSEKTLSKDIENSSIITTTIYVDDDNIYGPWNGTLEHPYQFIQDGINAAENGDQIYVFNGTYIENIVILKSVFVNGENKYNTIIDGNSNGNVVTITADNVELTDFLIINSGNNPNNTGLIVHSNWNDILNNTIKNNNIGVKFFTNDNLVTLNNFESNIVDMCDSYSNTIEYNYWDKYKGSDDNEDGIGDIAYNISGGNKDWLPLIHHYGSIINLDTKDQFFTIQSAIDNGNTQPGNTIFVKSDIYYEHILVDKSINLVGENKFDTIIDGRKSGDVVKIFNANWINLSCFTIKNSGPDYINAGIMITSDNNNICNNIIKENFHGVYLKQSSDYNIISNNHIVNNNWNGIYVFSNCPINNGNKIFENIIENNDYAGIGVVESSYNYIYHNDFINNLLNAYDNSNNIWDDGYPSGGNYWDDYTGEDLDGDGIGDTPYEIYNGINRDRYPFIEPYGNGDTTPPFVEIISPQNGIYLRNIRLFQLLFRNIIIIFGTTTVEVDAFDHFGIQKVEFYLDANPLPEATLYQEPYIWDWQGGSIIRSSYKITVVAYDNSDNYAIHSISARKFF